MELLTSVVTECILVEFLLTHSFLDTLKSWQVCCVLFYVESILLSVLDPPSSPVVTLSQTDNSCSNILISWSTPSSDRYVTSYSVYRDGVSVYNGPDNQYTDNTQLNINTVYEYSVVAISCAGNSTAVMSVSIDGEITCLLLLLFTSTLL